MSPSTLKIARLSFRATRGICFLFLVLSLFAPNVSAQVTAGTPPFGSYGGGPEIINLANLNARYNIPILHKPGRGLNFDFYLTYDTSMWHPVGVSGSQVWANIANWGWSGSEINLGHVGHTSWVSGPIACASHKTKTTTHYQWFYTDGWNAIHNFGGSTQVVVDQCNGNSSTSLVATTGDGSGYKISVTGSTVNSLTSADGKSIVDSSITDRNGNTITGGGTYVDTLGVTTLIAAGSGTPTSPVTYTYTAPSGASPFYQVNYATYSIQTNFGCSGITEYGTNGTTTANLVSEIDLPDGSKYSFNYEPTPGHAGFVTGRLASVTLPTGGTISYTYSGGSNGIVCTDGSAATLTRTTPDGTWTYARSQVSGTQWQTIITDPSSAQNQTSLQFQGIYETQRKIYQGSTSGTLLQTVNTCYNASTSPCTSIAVTLPISQRTVSATITGSGNLQSQHTDKFDSSGNLTESDDYDFATAAPFPLLQQTLITYASLGDYLNAFRQTVIVKDGNGNIKFRQDTNYDQYTSFTGSNCITGALQHDDAGHGCTFTARANATSTTSYTDPVTPGGAVTKSFTYDSLGNLRTAQMNCCHQKSWAYSSTTAYAYPDSVTTGSSSPQLTTSLTYDLHMGLLLTSTDPNSLQTTLTYDNLGRVSTAKTGTNPTTNITYNDYDNHAAFTPWTIQVCSPIQGTNTACQKSILDKQGRTVTAQVLDGSSNLYSAVDTQYDAFGRAYKTSNPYTSSPSYWTQAAFDVLGRLTTTTLPDNSASSATFTDNTYTLTDPAGIQRKYVMDGLGRLTSAYEPDPSSGNTLTLQTSYTYNLLGELTGVTQGSQARAYVYDALGRLLSSTTPEGGRLCFGSVTSGTCNTDGYDSFDNLMQKTDARGVLTSYGYDTLNRLTSVSYNVSGATGVPPTPSVGFTYGIDSSCNSAHGAGCIGQLVTMTDGVGSENYTYNSLEQLTQLQKVINGSTDTTSYAYNLASQLTGIIYPSGRVVQQSVDAIGRLCEIATSTTGCGTASSPYATGYAYNVANQLTGFKYGNNITASFGYSPDRLQLASLGYTNTSSTSLFHLDYGYTQNGGNNGQITSVTNPGEPGQSVNYTYDALNRLSTAISVGSTGYPKWGLSETYDRYGNRSAQTAIPGAGCVAPMTCPQPSVAISATTNRIVGSPYAYDLSGNMTNDGINTLVYDAESHVVSATNGSSAGAYVYDGNGLRVKRCVPNCTSPTTTTVYLFSGSKVIAEYDNGAAVTSPSREYIYSGAGPLAKIEAGATTYYHSDHLSVRFTTDSNQNYVAHQGQFPFGEMWYDDLASIKTKFTTYERDSESGNDYAQARYNVSGLARFSSPDPIAGSTSDPQSLNRYSYVRNMPVMLTDPLGSCPPVVLNRDSNDSKDTKADGPSATDSRDGLDTAPEAPQQGTPGGCGTPPWYYTSGGGGGGAAGLDGGYNGDDSGFGIGSGLGVGGGLGFGLIATTTDVANPDWFAGNCMEWGSDCGNISPWIQSVDLLSIQAPDLGLPQILGNPPNPNVLLGPPKQPQPPLECRPEFIAQANKAWLNAGYGFRDTEAGFSIHGSFSTPGYVPIGNTNEFKKITFRPTPNDYAFFHTHPSASSPLPSPAPAVDQGYLRPGDQAYVTVYTASRSGLYMSVPNTNPPYVLERQGLDWLKPCP